MTNETTDDTTTPDTSAKGRAEAAYDTWAAAVRSLTKDGPTMLEIWQSVVRAVDASKPSNPPTNEPADHWIAWRGSASDFVTDMKAVIPPAKLDFLKACLGAQDPEFARVHMTPVDKLRAIAGLVKLLPAGDYPSLWMSTPEAFALVSALPRAEIGVSVSVTGRSLHYASAHVDGLQIRASYVGPSEPPAMTAPESAS